MNPQLEELACLYVLDRLEERERADLEARLPTDRELVALLRELEAELARRIHSLPQHEPPSGTLASIEARIDRLSPGGAGVSSRNAASLWASAARWGIAAAIAASLGIIAVQELRRASAAAEPPFIIVVGLDSLGSTLAKLPVREHPPSEDASFIQLASLAERFWEKPGDLPVKLDSASRSGLGYALFDPASNEGFIGIQQLPAIEQGRRYHVWILDMKTGQIRQAGVLPDSSPSPGLYFFSVAPSGGAKLDSMNLFVTSEDASTPDSAKPRGKVVLGDRKI
jgi:hypothetical protein